MSLVTRLMDRVAEIVAGEDGPEASDERLAAAALLVHVARVDGTFDAKERNSLIAMLGQRFDLPAQAAKRLVERADALDRGTDDVADLIDMMGHGLDDASKRGLVGMAYRLAAVDGRIDEFEEDLVWRLGRLLGFTEPDIAGIRVHALAV